MSICAENSGEEFGLALDKTMKINQVIWAVIVYSENLKKVKAGQDARKFKNTYSVCKN